jgi:tetratricopeptide (TPR) repeat protein
VPAAGQARRAAELAEHLQLANAAARALPYLLLAADQAEAVFAHHEATQRYRAAVRVAAQVGDRAAEAQALVGLGRSWLAAGHPEHALEHFEAAVQVYRELDDPEAEGETLARISQVYFARGSWDAGIERLPALIERLEQRPPSRALGLLHACLAAVMPAEPAARIRAAARASELARALCDDDLLVEAEANRGFVLMLAGRLPEARAALEAILPLAEARRVYQALPMVIGALGESTKLQGDTCAYLRLGQRAVARAEESGDTVALLGALSGVGEAEFLLGDWATARRTYERAAGEGAGLDAAWYLGFVQLGLAALDVAEGKWTAAEQQLARCLVESPRLGHHNRREHAQRLLARRYLLADEPAAALARLEDVVRVEGDAHAGTQALRAWALLAAGDHAGAAEVVARAVDLACSQGNRLDLCEALLVRGQIESCQGRLDAAARTLTDGLALAQAMPWPYAEARLRYARARAWSEHGQRSTAAQDLELALAIFRRLGARPYLDKAEQLAAGLTA